VPARPRGADRNDRDEGDAEVRQHGSKRRRRRAAAREGGVHNRDELQPSDHPRRPLILSRTVSGTTLFGTVLTAGGLWTQPNPTKNKWKYRDPNDPPATGIKKALLSEVDPTGIYRLKVIGKSTSIAGPLGMGEGIRALVEISQGGSGICAAGNLATCTSSSTQDRCGP